MANPKKWNHLLYAAENVLWKLSHNHEDKDFSTTGKTHPALIDRNDAVIRILKEAVEALARTTD